MGIKTIEAIVEVGEDRVVSLHVPPEIKPGRHLVVAVIDQGIADRGDEPGDSSGAWAFPVLKGTRWPAGLILCREGLYDE